VEDSLEIAVLRAPRPGSALDVAIIHLEHLSNFDEFDGLVGEPGVSVRLVDRAHELGQPDLIVLPGSKTTVVDLLALRSAGLDAAILAARQAGSAVLGICAGYQMLGHRIDDSLGVESVHESVPGLGLLPAWTTFGASKVTAQREATVVAGCGLLAQAKSQVLRGYEMRMGAVLSTATVPLILDGRSDGSMSDDGWVVGTSLHGLLSDRLTRRLVLEALPPPAAPPSDPFDQLADVLEGSLDLAQIERMAGLVRV
jgi:adenosylcobyric acid synthase